MDGWLWWLACAGLTGIVAKLKNFGFWTGFTPALFLGPLALIGTIIAPKDIPEAELGITERWLRNYHSSRRYKPDVGEAVATILNGYANALAEKTKLGYTHLNSSHLPYKKKIIEAAFIIAVMTSTNEEVTEQLMVGALTLVDWQPFVSEDPLTLDDVSAALRPNGKITDELINKTQEMSNLLSIGFKETNNFYEQLKEARAKALPQHK